jgi:hypothetical protein
MNRNNDGLDKIYNDFDQLIKKALICRANTSKAFLPLETKKPLMTVAFLHSLQN